MVRMCSLRSLLILSSIAASVVDLPLPVGPVTSTSPRGRSASVASTAGSPRSLKVLICSGINRYTAPTAPRWLKTFDRNRAMPRMPNEKSSSSVSSKRFFCTSVMTL